MPPRLLYIFRRYPNLIIGSAILIGINAAFHIFPEPPAVEEARRRKWAAAEKRREDELTRAMERRVEEIERKNPGAFGANWEEMLKDNWEDGSREEGE